jgi:serine/threonine-protein kinase
VTGLLSITSTDEPAESLVARTSVVRRTFDEHTQDSGNVSWLVESDGRALFVKSAGLPAPVPGAPTPLLDHSGRVELLHNAVRLSRSCDHPALATLRNVIATGTGPALVYDAAPGELVGVPTAERADPRSPYQRFAHLPGPRMLAIFDVLIDLHVSLAKQGWVASDLYDGCLIVAPDDRLTIVDLDTYQLGPFTNRMGRMFGSDRFMAPEEHELGATIDQRTTVFTLARLVIHFGTRLTENLDSFVGSPVCATVLLRACQPDPSARYPTVADFATAWTAERRTALGRLRAWAHPAWGERSRLSDARPSTGLNPSLR